jgi:hypothetical protein
VYLKQISSSITCDARQAGRQAGWVEGGQADSLPGGGWQKAGNAITAGPAVVSTQGRHMGPRLCRPCTAWQDTAPQDTTPHCTAPC